MKHKKFLVSVFLIILFCVSLSIGVKYLFTEQEITDNYKIYEKKEENNILDKYDNDIGALKVDIDNILTNDFPFYYQINKLFQDINIQSDKFFFTGNDLPLGTNSFGEYVFFNQKDGFYYSRTQYSRKELDKRMLDQASFFNALSNKGIELYLYLPSKYELTSLPDNNLYSYYERFKSLLNKDIKIKNLEINSVDEYKDYFYLSDHHWKMAGALKGYYEIMDMLNKKPIDKDQFFVYNREERVFYGSYAKSTSGDLAFDYVSDISLFLDYKINITDINYKSRDIRVDKEDIKYYDYFTHYFDGRYDKVIYDFEQSNKENLLIMSDSYAWSIDYLIASSFNKTHVINLRYGELKDNSFNLSKYIEDNNISKVLFLYEGEAIIFDQYNYNFIGRVK